VRTRCCPRKRAGCGAARRPRRDQARGRPFPAAGNMAVRAGQGVRLPPPSVLAGGRSSSRHGPDRCRISLPRRGVNCRSSAMRDDRLRPAAAAGRRRPSARRHQREVVARLVLVAARPRSTGAIASRKYSLGRVDAHARNQCRNDWKGSASSSRAGRPTPPRADARRRVRSGTTGLSSGRAHQLGHRTPSAVTEPSPPAYSRS